MATIQVQMFAARHGVHPDAVFAGYSPEFGVGMKQAAKLQNELAHYDRGWGAYMEGSDSEPSSAAQATAKAHESYQKMTSWNASLGVVSREEYVAGYVDAWTSRQTK